MVYFCLWLNKCREEIYLNHQGNFVKKSQRKRNIFGVSKFLLHSLQCQSSTHLKSHNKQFSQAATSAILWRPFDLTYLLLCVRFPCSEFSWSIFSSYRTEYGQILRISRILRISLRIQYESHKIRTRKTPNTDTFTNTGKLQCSAINTDVYLHMKKDKYNCQKCNFHQSLITVMQPPQP